MNTIDKDAESLPMQQMDYVNGTGARCQLLIFTKTTKQLVRKYGGNAVCPLYVPQALRLRTRERKVGFVTQLFRWQQDGKVVIESDFYEG